MEAHRGKSVSAEESLRLSQALQEYRRVTGQSLDQMAAAVGVERKAIGAWLQHGRMRPMHVPAVRLMLAGAGIEYVPPGEGAPAGFIALRDLARAAMLFRLGEGPAFNDTELGLLRELGTEVQENEVAVVAMLNRVSSGHSLSRQDGRIFRDVFDLPLQ